MDEWIPKIHFFKKFDLDDYLILVDQRRTLDAKFSLKAKQSQKCPDDLWINLVQIYTR